MPSIGQENSIASAAELRHGDEEPGRDPPRADPGEEKPVSSSHGGRRASPCPLRLAPSAAGHGDALPTFSVPASR